MLEGVNDAGLMLIGALVATVIISAISLAYVSSVRKIIKKTARLEQARFEEIERRLPKPPGNGKVKKNGGNNNNTSHRDSDDNIDPLNPWAKKASKKGGHGLFGRKHKVKDSGIGDREESWKDIQ